MKHLRRISLLLVLSFVVWGIAGLMFVGAEARSISDGDAEAIVGANFVEESVKQFASFQQQPGSVTLEGTLNIMHMDPARGSGEDYYNIITLNTGPGMNDFVILDTTEGQVWDYLRQRVRVVGRSVRVPAEQNHGQDQIIAVDMILPLEENRDLLDPSIGNLRYINILCQFSDSGSPSRQPSYFNELFANTYPGIGDHWSTASYGKVNITSDTMNQWVRMNVASNIASFFSDPFQVQLVVGDACLSAADPFVDFTQYDGITMMFDQDYIGFALGTPGITINIDGQSRQWRLSWNPTFSYEQQFFISHEIGHTIQLSHSASVYPSNSFWPYDQFWDVMSGGGENFKLPNATLGPIGPGTNAYSAFRMNWLDQDRIAVVNGGESRTLDLERILEPINANSQILALIPIDDSTTDYYAVEAHFENSYDAAVPDTGVVIYRVDLDLWNAGQDAPARVIDPDNDGDANDAAAIWLPGETYSDTDNNISITVNSQGSSSFNITVNNDSAPSLIIREPLGYRTDIYGNPIYEWDEVAGASTYSLYVAGYNSLRLGPARFSGDVSAAQACANGTCSVDLTELASTAWLANGDYAIYICPSTNNCSLVAGWYGPYTFTIAAPPSDPPSNFFLDNAGLGWSLSTLNGETYTTWFQIYIAPSSSPADEVYFGWKTRAEICGDYAGTVCTLTDDVISTLTSGTEYLMYVRAWGSAGYSVSSLAGFSDGFAFTAP